MSKLLVIVSVLISSVAMAKSSNFCSPQAIAAAKGLASVNGSVDKKAVAESDAGQTYVVVLSDKEGEDFYTVNTSGGHDCTVYSVKINGEPTRYP